MRQMSRTTFGASKSVKFQLSWNSTKVDVVARFCEKIPTVKFVLLSEIKKIFGFLTEISILSFFRKLEFSGVLQGRLRNKDNMEGMEVTVKYATCQREP